jgi:hypothetical protein
VDEIPLSASTEGDIAAIREAFSIPESVTIRLPELGEFRSASRIPGETLVHPFFFGEGLRIPLPAYQQKFLAEVGLAISQLNPNTWRCLNALYTLYHHCGFGEPNLAVFFSQWVLEEHSKVDKGWYKAKTVLKPCEECPRDTERMDFVSRGRLVTRCCLMREALEREGVAGPDDIESHEMGSPEIMKDPLVFGNPTSQQIWKSRYFFVGGQWEFPEGAEVPAKRVPCDFREASGCYLFPRTDACIFVVVLVASVLTVCFLFAVDQSWRKLTEEQEREIEWIRDNISLVLRRSTVLLNRYSLHFSGLAAIPRPCEFPFLPSFFRSYTYR